MKYFIDHQRKSIHSQKFAGDLCGFISTPIAYREFTNCPAYVKRLMKEKEYVKCPHCVSAPTQMHKNQLVN